ncbi:HDOD domain-containing protein [Chitinibacter fontanus]|uniref:HDOD domain-containing protein n=1 Tax=Chitinibacter fontanus TaxID=1737446 RepID=A0A7D5ZBN4_9NEIS|nr:HDOD domain-containing protein [Chitinibacter fontanus]QLI83122.1 HDOD domain-containing protein [Chitinibacter fontanus]
MLRQIPATETEQLTKNLVIPPRPFILEAIKRAQAASEPDFDEIAELINSDLTLSLAMIKAVNSPFYQLTQKIHSVDQALQLLGLRNICNMVEGIILRQTLCQDQSQRMEVFWESAIRIAMISSHIAQHVHGITPEEAYTFGLFRSSGKAVMAARFDSYLKTLEKGERYSREEFIALEDRRYQTNHNVVGYLLSRTWYLPEDMQLAILNHHDFTVFDHRDEPEWHHVCTLIAIAGLAEHMLKMHVQQFEHIEWRAIEPILLEHLALKLEEYEDMIDEIATKL